MARVKAAGIPDARFIRSRLPVVDVARQLRLEVFGNGMIRCWHPDRHHNGDRTPSVGVWRKFNRVKCFGISCGVGPLTPIDLVGDVLGCTPGKAIRWIAERFEVPRIPRGKHLAQLNRHVVPYGHEDPLELLIASGLWVRLWPVTQRVATVMISLAHRVERSQEWEIRISYRALMRYSGVGSFATIKKALDELQAIGWLKAKEPCGVVQAPIRHTASYVITPYSDQVRELANSVARDFKTEIDAERELRREQRVRRAKQRRDQNVQRDPVQSEPHPIR